MTLSHADILALLPHREPFLLVDRAMDVKPGLSIQASVYASPDWEIFQAHFPEHPVLPGNYITESLAQAADLALLTLPQHRGKLPLLMQVKNMRFLRPVSPGDTMELYVSVCSCTDEIYDCHANAYVNKERTAMGSFSIVLKE